MISTQRPPQRFYRGLAVLRGQQPIIDDIWLSPWDGTDEDALAHRIEIEAIVVSKVDRAPLQVVAIDRASGVIQLATDKRRRRIVERLIVDLYWPPTPEQETAFLDLETNGKGSVQRPSGR